MSRAAFARWAPRLTTLLILGLAASALRPPGLSRGYDLDLFGRLPVLEEGRVKPIDTVARTALLALRGQQELQLGGRTISATEWLLDLAFRPELADTTAIFQVDDPDVLDLLGLHQYTRRYFSFATLQPHIDVIQAQARKAWQLAPKERSRYQSALTHLYQRLALYYRLRNTFQLEGSPGLASEIATRVAADAVSRQHTLAQLAYFRPIPPSVPERTPWRSVGEALLAAGQGPIAPELTLLAQLGQAYTDRDPDRFNSAVASLRAAALRAVPSAQRHTDAEALFHRARPFYFGMAMYVATLLVLFAAGLRRSALLRSIALALLVAGAIIHTAGLVARILLQGRPPVTNLYSSVVFVGWVTAMVGLILEWAAQRAERRTPGHMASHGFGTAAAAATGLASLITAHHLASDGDTLEVMRAVLDSNFWLTTHVLTITMGYGGTFLAGAFAFLFTVRKHLLSAPHAEADRALVSMTYGTIGFALFFSFVGTALGGIWADQAWGRFWGWDPKENGALLVLLWNALILYARRGDYLKERGLMAMALFGTLITSLSWFGVNMLGIGLHSYGFMDGTRWALIGFVSVQLLATALCLIPPRFGRSLCARSGPISPTHS